MDNFDLKNFLVENKLTKTSQLNEENQKGVYLLFDKNTGKLDTSFHLPDYGKNDAVEKEIKNKGKHTLHFYTGNDYTKYITKFSTFRGKTAQELGI